METSRAIVSLSLTAVPVTGDPFDFDLSIEQPYLETEFVWRCIVTTGQFQTPLRVAGGDGFQALCLAIDYVRWTFRTFEEGGGRFLCAGEDFSLVEAYHFSAPN
ncbi:hypothetical protein [Sphingopyxis sp. RIFCSPHIGHO2_12_FULL_65_19]|uniref:hypothetical protein n=1 Tax=Sphingopyxis sp. RIFCSPHIGHO2_12_FULL_65_19 TaxID=1802172 RepID=UPI0025DB9AAA|nr:hypothetical protein [Sphingopyxis sp. RIFCSPHIGHO2_12_FULL_65_19]